MDHQAEPDGGRDRPHRWEEDRARQTAGRANPLSKIRCPCVRGFICGLSKKQVCSRFLEGFLLPSFKLSPTWSTRYIRVRVPHTLLAVPRIRYNFCKFAPKAVKFQT